MFAFLTCMLMLQQVHSACVEQGFCPDDPAVQAEIVDHHNAERRAVQPTASNMLRMNYSNEIAVNAQKWVDQCILGHGTPSTRLLNGYELGENLFYSSKPYSWTDVISAWNSEDSHFLYPNISSNGKPVGHYTQVVWSSSYEVGCGMTKCRGTYFYGCHYYRAGNFYNWPPYKAGPSCASCPNNCDDKLCTNPCPYINHFLNCPTMKKNHGCNMALMNAWCPASCKCPTEIIPIG